VQLVTIGMLPSGFIRAQSVKPMYWTVAFAQMFCWTVTWTYYALIENKYA
jgi:hypothetical protein